MFSRSPVVVGYLRWLWARAPRAQSAVIGRCRCSRRPRREAASVGIPAQGCTPAAPLPQIRSSFLNGRRIPGAAARPRQVRRRLVRRKLRSGREKWQIWPADLRTLPGSSHHGRRIGTTIREVARKHSLCRCKIYVIRTADELSRADAWRARPVRSQASVRASHREAARVSPSRPIAAVHTEFQMLSMQHGGPEMSVAAGQRRMPCQCPRYLKIGKPSAV